MSHQSTSNLFSRVIVAIMIIGSSIYLHSIAFDIWQGEDISILGSLLATGLIVVLVATLVYVIIQRMEMRKTEKFRREKW